MIEQALKEYILTKYEFEYNKRMIVENEGMFYSLAMELSNSDRPLMLAGEFNSDEEFLIFLKKEIDRRKPFRVEHTVLYMTDEQNRT